MMSCVGFFFCSISFLFIYIVNLYYSFVRSQSDAHLYILSNNFISKSDYLLVSLPWWSHVRCLYSISSPDYSFIQTNQIFDFFTYLNLSEPFPTLYSEYVNHLLSIPFISEAINHYTSEMATTNLPPVQYTPYLESFIPFDTSFFKVVHPILPYQNLSHINGQKILNSLTPFSTSFLAYQFWHHLGEQPLASQKQVFSYLYDPLYTTIINQKTKQIIERIYASPSFTTWNITQSAYYYHSLYSDYPDPSYNWVFKHKPIHKNQVMFGTFYMQHQIWAHQHPTSCEGHRVVYVSLAPSGLGSQLHVIGMLMAMAINYNAILSVFPQGDSKWVNKRLCHGHTSLECYFEPFTSCGVPYELLRLWNLKGNPFHNSEYYAIIDRFEDINLHPKVRFFFLQPLTNILVYSTMYEVPNFQYNILPKSSYSQSEQIAYWRAQSITYLVRPNKKTIIWMDTYRDTHCFGCREFYDASLHIRQGDKFIEMTIVNEQKYAEVLDKIQKLIGDIHNVYVNADSATSIQYLEQRYAGSNISISKLSMARTNDGFNKLSTREDVALISLTDLREQVRSRLILGTYSSNWNRLIYELRSTVGFGDTIPFIEVGDTTCLNAVHCHDRSLTFDTIW